MNGKAPGSGAQTRYKQETTECATDTLIRRYRNLKEAS